MSVLKEYSYLWPRSNFKDSSKWQIASDGQSYVREMPETREELALDSQWPGFFPSAICYVTTTDGVQTGLEKVVGPSIINRFPYVLMLSFCREELSDRHHVRGTFTEMLEKGGSVAVQFLPPGAALDKTMQVITSTPDSETNLRILKTGLATKKALTNDAPVFKDAYLVYEAKLVKPGKDFQGQQIYSTSWIDVGSHRLYFLEINAIQLRQDIAEGNSQILWRSLPAWKREITADAKEQDNKDQINDGRYQKGYTPFYAFPSAGTIAFEADELQDGMSVKYLPSLPEDQVEVDNDRARWPCFFPSSAGMITTWSKDKTPNLMPCGSTTIVSRHPLVIAPCVCYAGINERYAPRATLDLIRKSGRFVCGVPYVDDAIVNAMKYTGNISLSQDAEKVSRAGLQVEYSEYGPLLQELPVQFECEVIDEVLLGTHVMFLGEVKRIRVRSDVSTANPMEWCPWADVVSVKKD